jgi:hypothetical protein
MPSQFRRAIHAIWIETSDTLKRAWLILWTTGAVLLAIGIWGDNVGFWDNKPFLTNTFSSLTGAAFGIPLALVVLQRVAASQADAAEARAAQRMAARISTDLAASAAALVEGGLAGAHAAKLHLQSALEATPLQAMGSQPSPQSYPLYVDAVQLALAYVNKLSVTKSIENIAAIDQYWSILRTESRSRLLETGGRWLAGLEVKELERLISAVTKFDPEESVSNCKTTLGELALLERGSADFHLSASMVTLRAGNCVASIAKLSEDVCDLITASAGASEMLSM